MPTPELKSVLEGDFFNSLTVNQKTLAKRLVDQFAGFEMQMDESFLNFMKDSITQFQSSTSSTSSTSSKITWADTIISVVKCEIELLKKTASQTSNLEKLLESLSVLNVRLSSFSYGNLDRDIFIDVALPLNKMQSEYVGKSSKFSDITPKDLSDLQSKIMFIEIKLLCHGMKNDKDKEKFIENLRAWSVKATPDQKILMANCLILNSTIHPLSKEAKVGFFKRSGTTTSMAIAQGLLARDLDGEQKDQLDFERGKEMRLSRSNANKAYENELKSEVPSASSSEKGTELTRRFSQRK